MYFVLYCHSNFIQYEHKALLNRCSIRRYSRKYQILSFLAVDQDLLSLTITSNGVASKQHSSALGKYVKHEIRNHRISYKHEKNDYRLFWSANMVWKVRDYLAF